jgi:hypothetical protein
MSKDFLNSSRDKICIYDWFADLTQATVERLA